MRHGGAIWQAGGKVIKAAVKKAKAKVKGLSPKKAKAVVKKVWNFRIGAD